MKRFPLLLALLLAAVSANLSAQNKIELPSDSTVLTILQGSTGQTVELRLRSGEKMGGKIERATEKVVHLSQLTGAEFFEAFVDPKDISAVVIRAKNK
jgi:hypothetical protein